MSKNNEIIVGLDLGTTKTCALVGKVTKDGVDIIGVGSTPSCGIKSGVIVDIDLTLDAVSKAAIQAELMSGYKIKNVYVGVSGSHINCSNEEGQYPLKGQPVTQKDIEKAVELAQSAKVMEPNKCMLHVEKMGFTIDGQKGIKNPLGIPGNRLESRVHIVTANTAFVDNIKRCVEANGMTVDGAVFEAIASGYSVLLEEEKDLGVALIDIGGGTTDLTIFYEGNIVYSSVIPFGGNILTKDLSECLRTPFSTAEELKVTHGAALSRLIIRDDTITVPIVGGRGNQKIYKHLLAEVIEDRLEQAFTIIERELKRSGYYNNLSSGIVITGGTSLLNGITDFARDFLNLPVRAGRPTNFTGLKNIASSPIYSTAVGLIMYAGKINNNDKVFNYVPRSAGVIGKLMNKARNCYDKFSDEYF
jgi:cell division protein FtsA